MDSATQRCPILFKSINADVPTALYVDACNIRMEIAIAVDNPQRKKVPYTINGIVLFDGLAWFVSMLFHT